MSEEKVITSQPTFDESPRLITVPREDIKPTVCEDGIQIPMKPLITMADEMADDNDEISVDVPSNPADCCCYIADDKPLAKYCLCRKISRFFVCCGLCTEMCIMHCFFCICDCAEWCNSSCKCDASATDHFVCCRGDCGCCDNFMHCPLGVTDCLLCFNFFRCWYQ